MAISREAVEDFWAANVGNGVAMNGPLLWVYFFTNDNRFLLEQAIARLEELGYRYVAILHPDEDDNTREYTLHVERVEVHSIDSLLTRCGELGELGIGDFDGFDAGSV